MFCYFVEHKEISDSWYREKSACLFVTTSGSRGTETLDLLSCTTYLYLLQLR